MRLLAPTNPPLWTGRAAFTWARRLAGLDSNELENRHLITVAQAIGAIHGRQEI